MANIREAQVADYGSINWLSHYLGYRPISDDDARINLQYLIASNIDKVWVCEQQDHILGWIHLFVSQRIASPRFAEIGGLVVDPECYRKGLGRSLVYHAKLWAETHHMKLKVRCQSRRENTLKFYHAIGFKTLKNQQVLEFRHEYYEE